MNHHNLTEPFEDLIDKCIRHNCELILSNGTPGLDSNPDSRRIFFNKHISEIEARQIIVKRLDEILSRDRNQKWVKIIEEKTKKV